jgi:enoyl-CoA hydratase/carnithine racemase
MSPPVLHTLRIEHDDGASTATIVLNRPERLNALSGQLLGELIEACEWIRSRDHLKVVVVRGAGRAFSAGFDLADFAAQGHGGEHPGRSIRESADLGRLAAEALTDVGPLTIAAIHGHCVGGGLVLATACDLRIAAAGTSFSIPEVDLGIPLAWGGIPRLVRELGPAVTKELVLTCRSFDADEARELGLLNRVVAGEALIDEVDRLATELSRKPGYALRTTKQQVNAITEEIAGTRRNAADADALVVAFNDPESQAASRAYLERRSR